MGKMNELLTTQDIVMDVLEEIPETRDSDSSLCYWVYTNYAKKKGINLDSIPISIFFLHMNEYGFPPTETIRRSRQKIQKLYPELRADEQVEAQRMLNEEVFKDYAIRP